MKPVDVKDNLYIDFKKEVNNKILNLKLLIMYEFAKGYTPNWSEEVIVIKKVENAVPWTYAINDLNGEEIIGTFYEKELQKANQHEFRIEKIIKRKDDKLHVKWKGYDSSFNSWIDRKDIALFY